MAEQKQAPKQSRGQSLKRAIDTNLDSIPSSPNLRKAIAQRAIAKQQEAVTAELITKPKNKVGRPAMFTQELADKICELIAEGMSLRQICEMDEMPTRISVRRWLIADEKFSTQYIRAREDQADHYAETINEIADKTLSGRYDPLASRVAIDAYKWTASKLKPKKYGDKVDLTSDGKALPTPILGIINPSQPDETQRLQSGE